MTSTCLSSSGRSSRLSSPVSGFGGSVNSLASSSSSSTVKRVSAVNLWAGPRLIVDCGVALGQSAGDGLGSLLNTHASSLQSKDKGVKQTHKPTFEPSIEASS